MTTTISDEIRFVQITPSGVGLLDRDRPGHHRDGAGVAGQPPGGGRRRGRRARGPAWPRRRGRGGERHALGQVRFLPRPRRQPLGAAGAPDYAANAR